MGLPEKIYEYREYIILLGLIIGALKVFGALPDETEFLTLGSNVKFVYLGVIAIAGFTFHKFYWNKGGASFTRNVGERNLSNPAHYDDLMKQRGTSHSTPPPKIEPQRQQPRPQVSDEVWDKFKRE